MAKAALPEVPTELQIAVTTALQNATHSLVPFPHFFAENVFPEAFYSHMQNVLATKENYKPVEGKFSFRTFSNTNDLPELDFMFSKTWFKDVLMLFTPQAQERFGGRKVPFARDVRLIRDAKHYSIGPHSDIKKKVISLLFYLPDDKSLRDFGTHFYRAKPEFVRREDDDNHGRHYDFEMFEDIGQMPFLPNSCFGFWRTDDSWHGVPEIPLTVRRDVLLYNIYTAEEVAISTET